MKRRIVKVGDRRYRVELPGGDVSEFSYREKARQWNPDQCDYLEFDLEEDRYLLSWEGLFLDSFSRQEELLLFLIRFGYSIDDEHLVPSEILADFYLVYEAGDWVDEWGCPDQHDVVFALGAIERPGDRKIRFEGYPRITPLRKSWRRGSSSTHGIVEAQHYRTREYEEVHAEIEIPKLDFDELEKPKQRRRAIARDWSNPREHTWPVYAYTYEKPDRVPDEECVFTLETGDAAKKTLEARKK